ncbi:MAG: response regulator [Cyanobacteria bacterium SBLK]|nr:response regulator [Cyanobacteria bacterium SBLK]
MAILSTNWPKIKNYQVLELIHDSDRTLVYPTREVNDGQSVVIKLMRNEYPSFQELVQLRNQYAIMLYIADANAKNLEIEGIVRLYTLEPLRERDIDRSFDFASILKAPQALAEIVRRDELLRRLTQIILQNKDSGIGIALDNMDKLFQPPVQIDSALNRRYEETGLGLALVKQLVELHGGQAIATGEPDIGSSFMVDLPQNAPNPSPSLLAMPTIIEEERETQLDTAPSILLVEDDLANITTLSSYLELKGYRLALAENGQEAIELARSLRPDLILMDIQMPVMDGLEAIKQIRQEMKEIPIFALTALVMKGDRERCLEVGADEYLSKPLKLKMLNALIQKYLSKMRES